MQWRGVGSEKRDPSSEDTLQRTYTTTMLQLLISYYTMSSVDEKGEGQGEGETRQRGN